MQILKQNEDGSVDVKLTRAEVLAIGASVWVAGEEGYGQSYERFFPSHSEQEECGVTADEFDTGCWSVRSGWKQFVNMG